MEDILLTLVAGATSSGDAASSLIDLITTADDPTASAVTLPPLLEFGAVVTGAISGALVACDKKLDIIGVCVLALITALGGGLVRDMILPTEEIYMLDHPLAVILTAVAGIAAFFFSGLFYKLDKPIAVFDILSVALFTLSGSDKALLYDYGLVPCVLMGVITGVGGGLCRDVCLGRIPNIFKSGNFYAICSVAGAVVYFVLVECHVVKTVAGVVCVVVVVWLRWISLRYNLITAVPVDLTPKLMGPLGQLRHRRRTAAAAVAAQAGQGKNDGRDDDATGKAEKPEGTAEKDAAPETEVWAERDGK